MDGLFPTEESKISDTTIDTANNNVSDNKNALNCLQQMKEFTNIRELRIREHSNSNNNIYNDEGGG